ncbi:hypothetical protein ACQR07_29290 [Bradyrhizobium sp. HKCCYLS20291]
MPIKGRRLNRGAAPVPIAILNSFRDAPVAVMSDNMNRLHGSRSLSRHPRFGHLMATPDPEYGFAWLPPAHLRAGSERTIDGCRGQHAALGARWIKA